VTPPSFENQKLTVERPPLKTKPHGGTALLEKSLDPPLVLESLSIIKLNRKHTIDSLISYTVVFKRVIVKVHHSTCDKRWFPDNWFQCDRLRSLAMVY
jgi:hypothetical protein